MDLRLVGWARLVKAAHAGPPPLWLFTDSVRTMDLEAAVRRLPVGLAGVVLREGSARRARAVAALCRRRRLALVVAGDAALAARLRAGVHLRGGVGRPRFRPPVITSSAHDAREMARARRAGAGVIFLSPVFATASHPQAETLGVLRWAAVSRRHCSIGALGGVHGTSLRLLPHWCRHIGAIGALAATARPKALSEGETY